MEGKFQNIKANVWVHCLSGWPRFVKERDMELRQSIPINKQVAVALWIEVCLEKVLNDTWNEKYNAFF